MNTILNKFFLLFFKRSKGVTVLDLTEKLLAIPQRENAGSRSSNRFDYQQVWAFNRMLDMLKEDKDFLLFMELHDDVIVLESTSESELIDFYQIKTDDKASRYIKTSFLTKDAKKYPSKMSILQKMIDNYSKFKSDTGEIRLVSNKKFDFGKLKSGDKSTDRAVVSLRELNDSEFNKLKQGMCQACHLKEPGCGYVCRNLIYFDVSFLGLTNYEETILGKFVNQLSELGIESTISKTKTIFYTILGEIKRINNWESKAHNRSELLNRKSISRIEFSKLINQLREEMPDDLWNSIQEYLLNDGFPSFAVNKIRKEWKKYHLNSMDVGDLSLQTIKDEIQNIIDKVSFDSSKEFADYIYSSIKDRRDVKIYSKEYVYAIIIKELFT